MYGIQSQIKPNNNRINDTGTPLATYAREKKPFMYTLALKSLFSARFYGGGNGIGHKTNRVAGHHRPPPVHARTHARTHAPNSRHKQRNKHNTNKRKPRLVVNNVNQHLLRRLPDFCTGLFLSLLFPFYLVWFLSVTVLLLVIFFFLLFVAQRCW